MFFLQGIRRPSLVVIMGLVFTFTFCQTGQSEKEQSINTSKYWISPSASKEKLIFSILPEGNYSGSKLRFWSKYSEYDKSHTIVGNKVEIPFEDVNPEVLWVSGQSNLDKKWYYYYTLTKDNGEVLIPETYFDGVQFRENETFAKTFEYFRYSRRFEEYAKCVRKFPEATLKEGKNYIADNGLYRNDKAHLVAIILNSACGKYKGTDAYNDCSDHFTKCLPHVRFVENKNTKYNPEN
ncbi:hypothetical protein EHQ61_07305 [Leptospira wolffii]|uniref:hypothetical protein n=1 Tax=Leptospira wolffii TaxID=409998 RepID=UPI001083021C|nr:hypothetical protein [Leptospira wolffii]TGL52011.1 hypothetical protein EHQ61_07305 [Leptospira wolffii]